MSVHRAVVPKMGESCLHQLPASVGNPARLARTQAQRLSRAGNVAAAVQIYAGQIDSRGALLAPLCCSAFFFGIFSPQWKDWAKVTNQDKTQGGHAVALCNDK